MAASQKRGLVALRKPVSRRVFSQPAASKANRRDGLLHPNAMPPSHGNFDWPCCVGVTDGSGGQHETVRGLLLCPSCYNNPPPSTIFQNGLFQVTLYSSLRESFGRPFPVHVVSCPAVRVHLEAGIAVQASSLRDCVAPSYHTHTYEVHTNSFCFLSGPGLRLAGREKL